MFSVRSDSFHRQIVQLERNYPVSWSFTHDFPPAYRGTTVSVDLVPDDVSQFTAAGWGGGGGGGGGVF
jgi:hypothetical protein